MVDMMARFFEMVGTVGLCVGVITVLGWAAGLMALAWAWVRRKDG